MALRTYTAGAVDWATICRRSHDSIEAWHAEPPDTDGEVTTSTQLIRPYASNGRLCGVRVHRHGHSVSAVRSVTVDRMQGAAADHCSPNNRPCVIGIVNITEDSFSDGGRYLDTENALSHARQLRSEGADIIELGPAASHPDSVRVTAEEEQRRLVPVLGPLIAAGIPISVDSFLTETQRFAISYGVTYLNDIQGFPDPGFYDALAESGCRLIVMHSVQRIGPATKIVTDPTEIWAGIDRFFARRLDALVGAGIAQDRLIIDPGLGYFLGSNPEPSLAALAGIPALKARFGVPVLVSPSRKSFLRTLTGRDIAHTGPATLAAELYAACHGVDYIRTHDVTGLCDGLTVLTAITGYEGPGGDSKARGI